MSGGGELSFSSLVFQFLYINLALAFFNLLPVPPLDGSRILYAILPAEMVYRLRPAGAIRVRMILFLVVFFVPQVLNVLVWTPVQATARLLIG